MINLLSNAIKFTAEGRIRIQVEVQADGLHLSVSDTGMGISDEDTKRLFRPFDQLDTSTTRRFGGTGLGLAISSGLARQMGGRLSVDSDIGVGSTFSLHVPLPVVQAMVAETVSGPVADGETLRGIRVLAAEDIDINRLILEDILRSQGSSVSFAVNGQEAVERFQEGGEAAFDIVLMDIQMPLMDGYEATKRIHALIPDFPIIGLTAHAMREERERILAAGMLEHITKPIDPPQLTAAILNHARNLRRHD